MTSLDAEILAARLYAAFEDANDLPCDLDDPDYVRCIEHLLGERTAPSRLQPAIDLYVAIVQHVE